MCIPCAYLTPWTLWSLRKLNALTGSNKSTVFAGISFFISLFFICIESPRLVVALESAKANTDNACKTYYATYTPADAASHSALSG